LSVANAPVDASLPCLFKDSPMRSWTIIVCLLAAAHSSAQEPVRRSSLTICSMDDLVRMDECQLLDLYRNAQPGPVPSGFSPGRVIPGPGKKNTVAKSNLMKHVWQGKYFDDDVMTNRFFGIKFIKGQVTSENSWIDGKPVKAIDYSGTSLLFKKYRDEIREVAPGIYLGVMWKRDDCAPKLLTWFAIDARCQ
jgi:hypothetical protein